MRARGNRFVEGTCAYLTCLVSPAEVLPLARAGRDRMLARVVLDGLQRQIAGFGAKDLGRAMQARNHALSLLPTLVLP